jgi:hypothetical protein
MAYGWLSCKSEVHLRQILLSDRDVRVAMKDLKSFPDRGVGSNPTGRTNLEPLA